jgi:DNA-binding response OmpR family regulator
MKILIVDDSISVLELLMDALAFPGVEIQAAFDGSEALTKALHQNFDLIISDVRMPFMGGIEFGYKLRESNRETPIIYFSAEINGLEESKMALAAIGRTYYVENKNFKELVQLVSKMASTT